MIKKIRINDIPKTARGRGRTVQNDIKKFLSGGDDCVEVVVPDGRKAKNVAISYRASARRSNFSILVLQRNDRVFLVRSDVNA